MPEEVLPDIEGMLDESPNRGSGILRHFDRPAICHSIVRPSPTSSARISTVV
jgi:hypothetical protein